MPKRDGAKMVLKQGLTVIAGARSLTLTVNGSAVDVQDQGSAGVQEFLAGKVTGQSVELSIEGYEEDGIVKAIGLGPAANKFLSGWTVEFDGGGVIACDWVLSSWESGGPYEDGETFSATLQSDGAWTYTPGA